MLNISRETDNNEDATLGDEEQEQGTRKMLASPVLPCLQEVSHDVCHVIPFGWEIMITELLM